jgi:murein DD-endopeptidase MepM/ murein hydrolase activator NlpD
VAGRAELQQGDIFAMKVLYLPEGIVPTASTALGSAIFTPVEHGWFAAVGIGNVRQPGEYPVSVTAGAYRWDVNVTVLPFEFDTQNLIIDESDPVISEANSPEAIRQYNDVMIPMYQTYDEERYWDGLFIRPTEGWISTQFGEIRYTNGDMSSGRPHWGMDIAAAEGTEVIAPNHGRVVFADYLLAVGYTVIIEHGGGLKSYYYHMSELDTAPGAMVQKGEPIGKVGSTGYSTGPHLHYEMRLGGREQVVSPSMLFNESAGLYSADLMPGAQS